MEENITVITKDDALELLEESKNNYFNNKINTNDTYLVSYFLLAATLGVGLITGAALLFICSPLFLVEYIFRKIFEKKESKNENNNSTN